MAYALQTTAMMMRNWTLTLPLLASVALACQGHLPVAERAPTAPSRAQQWASLVAATGHPEVPRYIRFYELDPQNRARLLLSPTLQRGRIGRGIVLRRDVRYLFSVAVDGTILVGEKRRFGSNEKCGHPNLTLGQPARMSGEIYYDTALKRFVMDNDSGRYGFQITRRRSHLEAARALLALVGCHDPQGRRIRPLLRWIPPRDGKRYREMDRKRPVLKGAPPSYDAASWRRRFLAALKSSSPRNASSSEHALRARSSVAP